MHASGSFGDAGLMPEAGGKIYCCILTIPMHGSGCFRPCKKKRLDPDILDAA